jgi:hypothetical protein
LTLCLFGEAFRVFLFFDNATGGFCTLAGPGDIAAGCPEDETGADFAKGILVDKCMTPPSCVFGPVSSIGRH